MRKYFVTIFILLYLLAGVPKFNNSFTSLIIYEFFSNVSTMQMFKVFRFRFIWASRFLHLLFHIHVTVIYVNTLKSVNEYSS